MTKAERTRTEWVVAGWLLSVLVAAVALRWGLGRVHVVKSAPVRQATPDRLRGELDRQAAAWNRGDLDGFMDAYWRDDRLTFASGGTVTRGWQATLDRYRRRYQAEGKEMGTLTFGEVEVELLGPPTGEPREALVRGRWALAFARSEEKPNGLFTLLFRTTPDGWKVVADHTSAADPPKKD